MRIRLAALFPLAALVAMAAPARSEPRKPTPAAIEEAKRHMKAGAAFYNDPAGHKCEEALREFAKAYELSGSLNALKGMAICNLELERDGAAVEQYGAYLTGKGETIDPTEKAQIEADLAALKAAVSTVRLSSSVPGARITDVRTPARGFPIRNTYILPDGGAVEIGVHPGQHVFTASLEGHPDQVWQAEIANGGTFAHAFVFPTAPPPPAMVVTTRPTPTSVWVTAGVTAASGITWGVLAARARSLKGDYDEVNGTRPAAELQDLRSGVKAANAAADVLLGVTAAALGTTIVLYLTRPSRPSNAPANAPGRAPAGIYLRPAVGFAGGGAALGGSF